MAISAIVSIPHNLAHDRATAVAAVRVIAQRIVRAFAVAVDFAVHAPSAEGDARNYHAHLVISTSTLTPTGFGRKERYFDTKALRKSGTKQANAESFVALVRRWWERIANAALEKVGERVRVNRRPRRDRCREAWRMWDVETAQELEGEPLEYLGKERFEELRTSGLAPRRRSTRPTRQPVHSVIPNGFARYPRIDAHVFRDKLDELTSCLDAWHSIDKTLDAGFYSSPREEELAPVVIRGSSEAAINFARKGVMRAALVDDAPRARERESRSDQTARSVPRSPASEPQVRPRMEGSALTAGASCAASLHQPEPVATRSVNQHAAPSTGADRSQKSSLGDRQARLAALARNPQPRKKVRGPSDDAARFEKAAEDARAPGGVPADSEAAAQTDMSTREGDVEGERDDLMSPFHRWRTPFS